MKTFYDDNLERIDDVKVLLTLAHELLSRLPAEELADTKSSLVRTLKDLRRGKETLVKRWGGQLEQPE
jgi:hypothetical protein